MRLSPPQKFVVDQNWPFGTKISLLVPKKPPDSVKSLKWTFSPNLAVEAHWEKRQQLSITTLVQLFSSYMTSIPPEHLPDTLRHNADIIQTLSDSIQTPPDIGVFVHWTRWLLQCTGSIWLYCCSIQSACIFQTTARWLTLALNGARGCQGSLPWMKTSTSLL